MVFVARFKHDRSEEDVSYYRAVLGEPTLFPWAAHEMYFVVSRLHFTRIGPTMRGEIVDATEAEEEIAQFRESADWDELPEFVDV